MIRMIRMIRMMSTAASQCTPSAVDIAAAYLPVWRKAERGGRRAQGWHRPRCCSGSVLRGPGAGDGLI